MDFRLVLSDISAPVQWLLCACVGETGSFSLSDMQILIDSKVRGFILSDPEA